jgi:hypothetical protein
MKGEHMSYRTNTSANTPRFERQQARLRIAREALARVEAKYARKRLVKQRAKSHDKTGRQRSRAERLS